MSAVCVECSGAVLCNGTQCALSCSVRGQWHFALSVSSSDFEFKLCLYIGFDYIFSLVLGIEV